VLNNFNLIQGSSSTGAPLIQLKAISKVNQTISTDAAGTVVVAEVIQETNGVLLENGEITFGKTGIFRAQLQLNFDNSNNTKIDTWAEYWDGSAWELLTDSGAIIETANANEGNIIFESTFRVPAGFKLRFKARIIAGTAILNYLTTDNAVGVPSTTFIVYELPTTVSGLAIIPNNLSSEFYIGNQANGNATRFETDGTMVAEGEATVYDEVSQSFVGANIFAVAGRVDYNFNELTVDFATNARYPDEPIGIVIQAMHSWKIGGKVRPHLHWIQNQDAIPNILVAYRVYNNGEDVPSSWTLKALTSSDLAFAYPGSGSIQQIVSFNLDDSVFSSARLSFTFDCKIYRDTANASGLFAGADPYTGIFSAKYYDIHFEKDMNGSRQEFVK